MNELTGLYYSPWTERARWALDYHRIPYRYAEYTTLLGEPLLRVRAGKFSGKVSVPLLVTPDGAVADSFDIARFADRGSARNPLVPAAHVDAIRQWTDDAELALCSARIRATRRMQHSPESLAERLPAYIPGFLRRPFVPLSYLGAEFILRKYDLAENGDGQLLGNMDVFLHKAAQALENREFVFDDFSFADMVVATMLQAVTPVDRRYIDLGAASEQVMCEPALATKYAALIRWRDRIYAERR